MAFLLNGVVYMPVQVQLPGPVQDTRGTDTSNLINKDTKETQTDGLRKPIIVNGGLSTIIGYVKHFPSLQCQLLQWGPYSERNAIEISRIKADLPPERGGPMSVATITIRDDLAVRFLVAGELMKTCNLTRGDSLDFDQLKALLETLSDSYVFCAGISKEEFKAVCSGIRYEPKFKDISI
jgi:hypothetical protein